MPKKTSILIIFLVIIAGILIFLAISNERNKIGDQGKTSLTPTSVPTTVPFASLSFSAPILDLSDSRSTSETVDVILNTSGKPIFGAQIELSYDPEIIFDVAVANPEGSFFGPDAFIRINEVNKDLGRVSYAITLAAQAEEKNGQGVVMKMNFKVNREKSKAKETTITFLPKSMVATLKSSSSVLEQTIPLKIILSK